MITPDIYDETADPSPKWFIIFADLLALMITFFVLIYSTTVIEHKNWEDIKKSLQQRLNPLKKEEIVVVPETKSIPKITKPVGDAVNYLYVVLQKKLAQNGIRYIHLKDMGDEVMLDVESREFFINSSDELSLEGREKLDMLASLIVPLSNRMEIHALVAPTDVKDPLRAQISQIDRWQRSFTLARSVARHFEDYGYPQAIISVGRADSLFSTLPANVKHQPERIQIVVSRHALSRSKMEAGTYPIE